MDDSANATGPNFGHRTWILANSLGPVGFGSVGTGRAMTASCFYQVGGTGKAGVAYVGWPPAGPVPLQAFTATELDKSGWSLQSDTIHLDNATATVMDGTTSEPVTVSTKLGSYGAKYAMGMTPNGWSSLPGHSYAVTIGGTSTPIPYTVQVVDCSSTTTSSCAASDGGVGTTGTEAALSTTARAARARQARAARARQARAAASRARGGRWCRHDRRWGSGHDRHRRERHDLAHRRLLVRHRGNVRGPLAFVVLLLLALVLRRRKIL